MKLKENLLTKVKRSQSYNKVWLYYQTLVQSEGFLKRIAALRIKYRIPLKIVDIHGKKIRSSVQSAWESVTPFKIQKKFWSDIEKIMRNYGISYADNFDSVNAYVFDNKVMAFQDMEGNLCRIWDFVEERNEPFSKNTQDTDDKIFPIGIKISPYATQRDVLDYIKKYYPVLKSLQSKYKENKLFIGKFKARNEKIIIRNKYIYKLRNFKLKTIGEKLLNKFGDDPIYDLDEGEISNIISVEAKKRKLL